MRIAAPFAAVTAAGFLALNGGCQSSQHASADSSARPMGHDPVVAFKPGLRAELLAMRKSDQALRAKISQTPESKRRSLFVAILENNDENVERLEEIINTHGWPTISMVGKDGAEAAWLVAQHADRRPDFRERCLSLMQQAADSGEASKAHLAYLVDRVMVEISQQQLYGTQFWEGPNGYGPVPIIDQAGIDERRETAGLVPMEDYTLAMVARRPGAALAEAETDEDAPMMDEEMTDSATASVELDDEP